LFSVSGGRAIGGNELKLWDLTAGKDLVTVPAHENPIQQLALSVDGSHLATASLDKTVKLWEVSAILSAAGQGTGSGSEGANEFVPEPPDLPDPRLRSAPIVTAVSSTPPFAGANADDATVASARAEKEKQFRAGIIGLDTSHAVAFTQILN